MDRPPIVTRGDWGAEPAKDKVLLKHPVHFVVFSYNTGAEPCSCQEDCIMSVKRLQEKHMSLGLLDIHYNFICGGDGLIYEGRGFHFRSAKTPEHPECHGDKIDIAYIGDEKKDFFQPPHVLVTPALRLIHYGTNMKYIDELYEVLEDEEQIRRNPYRTDINLL